MAALSVVILGDLKKILTVSYYKTKYFCYFVKFEHQCNRSNNHSKSRLGFASFMDINKTRIYPLQGSCLS